MTTTFTFATWNLKWWRAKGAAERTLDFVSSKPWGLLALQEVTPEVAALVRERQLGDEFGYPDDLGGKKFGSALLSRDGWRLDDAGLIEALPRPWRGVHAVARCDDAHRFFPSDPEAA
jgi:hypothetical protein